MSKTIAAYLQGLALGLALGYFTAGYATDILMYPVAVAALTLATVGYYFDVRSK